VIGLGGLFYGVTGPLLSAFIPPMVREILGDRRTAIGTVMAIDNVLLLLLVPLAGAVSDRAAARGEGRLRLVVPAYVLAAAGMLLFPFAAASGIAGLILAMVVLYTGINMQRSPFHALLADSVPSTYRSVATGSVTFQMCLGAIVFLMLGRMLGLRPAFLIASGTVLVIAVTFAYALRAPRQAMSRAVEASFASLLDAAWSAVRGVIPGLRAIFLASLLVQLTFQTFTTWYALHATERFGLRPEDASIGFIAWAVGGALGALPAGFIGRRIGCRRAMALGFAAMAAVLVAADRVTTPAQMVPLLALASASWTLPGVNAYPLFVGPIPRERRGILAAMFLLSMALGGAVGDPLNGLLFDLFAGYRPLFLIMSAYTVLALVAVLAVPRGAGEAGTGPAEPARTSQLLT
jgi:MFS family permease